GVGRRLQSMIWPVSPPAASETVSVQVPSVLSPSNADSGEAGSTGPLSHGVVPGQDVSGLTLAASEKTTSMLSLLQPNVPAGTPGRSSRLTVVPPGLVRLIDTSRTQV